MWLEFRKKGGEKEERHRFDVVCTNVIPEQQWKLLVNKNYVECDPTIN